MAAHVEIALSHIAVVFAGDHTSHPQGGRACCLHTLRQHLQNVTKAHITKLEVLLNQFLIAVCGGFRRAGRHALQGPTARLRSHDTETSNACRGILARSVNSFWQRMCARELGPSRVLTRRLQALNQKRVQTNAADLQSKHATNHSYHMLWLYDVRLI